MDAGLRREALDTVIRVREGSASGPSLVALVRRFRRRDGGVVAPGVEFCTDRLFACLMDSCDGRAARRRPWVA